MLKMCENNVTIYIMFRFRLFLMDHSKKDQNATKVKILYYNVNENILFERFHSPPNFRTNIF